MGNKFIEPIRQSTLILIFRLFLIMFLPDIFYLIIRIVSFDLRSDWLPHRDITLLDI